MTPVFRLTTCKFGSFLGDGVHDWLTISVPSFLFGNFATDANDNTFYVLSLPSFKWHATGLISSPGRTEMTCTTTNNRQAIIIGGTSTEPASYNDPQNWEAQDPWTKGIHVFDMTALNFSDKYDADAPPYEASTLVRNSYNSRLLASFPGYLSARADSDFSQRFPAWDDPALESIFNTRAHDGSSHLSAGVISGIVIGAVVAATLLGIFIAWRVLRRRRRRRLATTSTQTLSQQALRAACPRTHIHKPTSENLPEPPPAYAKETPVHAQQFEMTNSSRGSERLHNQNSSELCEQATCSNCTSPEFRSNEVATYGASAEQESHPEWSHRTEMHYMATGQTHWSSGLTLSPETTGTHSLNQP